MSGIRDDMEVWIQDALLSLGGAGTVVEVARAVWQSHESQLRTAGDAFYTWQYDLRWAADKLRRKGKLLPAGTVERGIWKLSPGTS